MDSKLIYSGIPKEDKIELSIVIPTYKRARYLEDSIKSIINQKNEKKFNYEIIIVNNDPESDMSELVIKYKENRISFYSNSMNYGQVGNINQGIRLAKGKYIALLHDDDFLLDNYFDVIETYLNSDRYHFDCIITSNYQMHKGYCKDTKHKFLDYCFAYRYLYRKKTKNIYPIDNVMSLRNIYSVPTCGMVLRKSSIEEFGYFKDVRGSAWDYYNLRQFNKDYNILIIHDYVAVRRMYTGMSNIDKIQSEFMQEKLSMLEENSGNLFVRIFGKSVVYRRPRLRFLVGYALATFYFFSHNLDVDKSIPRALYKKLIDGGVYKL